ncbi:PQQ-binding-like beta-propeller repeat protein [Cellulomonas sp. P22]|uniref:outer membrane protein assembly factor BamB family protein n=1 Tax=Cellulomonas sp. P22 TaxID=3373189 RepID=UPI0037A3655A
MALLPGRRMEAVEVVEDEPVPVAARAQVTGPEPVSGPGRATRRVVAGPAVLAQVRRWWPAAFVVVGVLAVGAVVVTRSESARLDRLDGVAGLVHPIDNTLRERWSVPVQADGDVLAAGGGLAVVSSQGGTWTVTSYDSATGAERWGTALGTAAWGGTEGGRVVCPHSGADVGPDLVCLVETPSAVYAAGALGAAREAPVRIVTLSSADGVAVGGWAVAGDVLTVARAGDDVVLVTHAVDDHVLAERLDARSGAVVWTYRSEVASTSGGVTTVPTAAVTGSHVHLGGNGAVVLDVDSGEELFQANHLTYTITVSDGRRFGTWSAVGGGALHGESGRRILALPSLPQRPAVDDGSADDLVVLDGGSDVSVVDAASGAVRWRHTTDLDPGGIVADRLLLAGPGRALGLDIRSGDVVWDVQTDAAATWVPVTDGALVLVPVTAVDGTPELVAVGLGDGVRYWSVEIPPGVVDVSAQGGSLVVRTDADLHVLG